MADATLSRSVASIDFPVEQGATFSLNFELQDSNEDAINLTGAQVRSQIRETYSSEDKIADFTCTITNAAQGKFKIALTDDETAAIPVDEAVSASKKSKKYSYDIEIVFSDGTVKRYVEGVVSVWAETTK